MMRKTPQRQINAQSDLIEEGFETRFSSRLIYCEIA